MATCVAAVIGKCGVIGVFKDSRKGSASADDLCVLVPGARTEKMPLAKAVGLLRALVYKLNEGRCSKCGQTVTFESCELHERISRGRLGKRTVFNCAIRCNSCHTGHRGDHGFARARWGRHVK